MVIYRLAKTVLSAIFYPLFRIEVIGKNNIPKTGPVIICSNHISNLDPPVVGITSSRTIQFMAKEELFDHWFFGRLLSALQAFPIKRGKGDRQALRQGLKVLKDDKTLALFPEGTRSKTGELGKPLSGAGFFALRSDAAVVPCAIIGSYKAGKKLKVIYGKPMDAERLRNSKASAKEMAEAIMLEIKSLKEDYSK